MESNTIHFYRGMVRVGTGAPTPAVWASTRFGTRAGPDDGTADIRELPDMEILDAEEITSVDLMGLDREDTELIADAILSGNYLAKAGVKGHPDAVLFMLVSEALHALKEEA